MFTNLLALRIDRRLHKAGEDVVELCNFNQAVANLERTLLPFCLPGPTSLNECYFSSLSFTTLISSPPVPSLTYATLLYLKDIRFVHAQCCHTNVSIAALIDSRYLGSIREISAGGLTEVAIRSKLNVAHDSLVTINRYLSSPRNVTDRGELKLHDGFIPWDTVRLTSMSFSELGMPLYAC